MVFPLLLLSSAFQSDWIGTPRNLETQRKEGADQSIFEAFQDGDLVHLYEANLAAGLLNSGVANVSITLGNLATNSVGFDFARISTVPEPASLFLVGLCAAGLGYVRSRSALLDRSRQG